MTAVTAVSPDAGRRVAWFHCFAGIAGDMALGSLVDAGADLDRVVELLGRLPFDGWALDVAPVLRGGIAASQAIVTVHDQETERTYADIVELIRRARLPDRVEERSLAVFAVLAAVESALHRRPVDQVHFHEVGGHDTIIDVVGTVAALEVLGVDLVTSSAVATGSGEVRAAHGVLPNPAPAVVALLARVGAPSWGRQVNLELTTPTGAALVAALATEFGPMPAIHVEAQGFGAGSRDIPEIPNCTQVVIGVPVEADGFRPGPGPDAGQPVVQLEANVDDVTGEQMAHSVAALLESGAHDAWVTPVVMKKGRPGYVLHALGDPSAVRRLRQIMQAETGTLGVRAFGGQRWPAPRTFGSVDVDGWTIAIKVGPDRAKAEFDDVARAAAALGLPVREVARRAEALWFDGLADGHDGPT